ncbi:phage integrase Arm DNA-binding domain-containing protein [Acinetobacter nosocomialis]|uniref:phage integrase Arm DNA-binding domain-containing protein n=1 Tax=Acinetobacter nosocomialis TaxID=106654 RepID=UPI00124C4899|nr:phage integrase Arm DNA-binding domain-containing protein [Acinetobacter nosocomialis]
MARPRNTKNKDLPANLYRGDGSAWRYRHPVTGKFHSMGSDKSKAITAARKLNELLIPSDDLIGKVMGGVFFGEFADDYLSNKRRKDGKPVASTTIESYRSYLERCKLKWSDLRIDQITLFMANQLLDDMTASSSNGCRGVLIDLFNVAVSKGLCPDNPIEATMPKHIKRQRRRHTLEGLELVRKHSPTWLQNAIDLALLTTQRRVDILKMKWTDIQDGYLHVAQEKTTDNPEDEFEISEGAGYVRIKIDNELQQVLNRCKDKIDSPFIIHRVPVKEGKKRKYEKEHWTQVDNQYLSSSFLKAVKKSNAYPNLTGRQLPTFHEIRALAIFLHKKAGKSAQALAGHTSKKMTEHYEAGHEIIWNDVDVGIKLPFAEVT